MQRNSNLRVNGIHFDGRERIDTKLLEPVAMTKNFGHHGLK